MKKHWTVIRQHFGPSSPWGLLLYFLCGLLFIFLASPSPNSFSSLGWICLVPYFIVIAKTRWWVRLFVGFGYGLIYIVPKNLSGIWYAVSLLEYSTFHSSILTILFFISYILPFVLFAHWFSKIPGDKIQTIFLHSALFTILIDWMPAVFPVSPAHMLHHHPASIQIADIGGVSFVLFFLILVNRIIADVVIRTTNKKQALTTIVYAAMILAAIYGYGTFRIHQIEQQETGKPHLQVIAIQTNITQGESLLSLTRLSSTRMSSALEMTKAALHKNPHTDLVIWPEAPINTINNAHWENLLKKRVSTFSQENQVAILFGSYETITDVSPPVSFNCSLLAEPNGDIKQRYQKIHLVPFYEYDPLGKYNPYMEDGFLVRGQKLSLFTINKDVKIIPAICYEVHIPDYIRQGIARGGNLVVNQSNLHSFGKGNISFFDLIMTCFRAIEYRLPIIKVSNKGYGALIQATGIISNSSLTHPNETAATSMKIYAHSYRSLYYWFGSAFEYVFVFALLTFACRYQKEPKVT